MWCVLSHIGCIVWLSSCIQRQFVCNRKIMRMADQASILPFYTAKFTSLLTAPQVSVYKMRALPTYRTSFLVDSESDWQERAAYKLNRFTKALSLAQPFYLLTSSDIFHRSCGQRVAELSITQPLCLAQVLSKSCETDLDLNRVSSSSRGGTRAL